MSTTKPDSSEQDFIDAIFMCGQIAGIFSKHRSTHPERINAMREMILATTPPEVIEKFYFTHLAPKAEPE